MPRHIVRVDLAADASDFERVAVQPGHPLLDSSGSNLNTLHKWLGSRVAGAKWDGGTILYYSRGRDGSIADDVECRTVSEAELRGRLQPELETLQKQLREAKLASPNEATLHRFLTSQLEEHVAKLGAYDANPYFFQLRNPANDTKLLWCCGYALKSTRATSAALCPYAECGLLSMVETGAAATCSRCGTTLRQPKRFPVLAVAILLLILLGAGITAGLLWLNSKPSSEVAEQESTKQDVSPAKEEPVTYSLAGIVVDELTGDPVVGAQLKVKSTDVTATTDEMGRFHLNDLTQDTVEIDVSANGYTTQTLSRKVASDSRPTNSESDEIKLKGNVVLTGRVVDGFTEQPLPNATVTIGGTSLKATTDDNGTFRFEGLRGGTQSAISASVAGYDNEEIMEKLADGGEVVIAIPLTGNTVLKGTVIQVGTDTPIPGATVSILNSTRTIVADKNGDFQFTGMPGGSLAEIEANAQGYATKRIKFELSPAMRSAIRIGLSSEAILGGRVVDAATDQGIGAAQVTIAGTSLKAETGADGSFRIEGCRGGQVKIEVTAAGYPSQSLDQEIATDKDTEILVKLAGEGLIVGEVVDSVSGAPVVDATVSARTLKGKTDKEGKFRIERTPIGAIDIEIAAPGYLGQQLTRRLVAKEESSVLVRLIGDASLVGQVIEAETKKPVAGAFVTIEGSRLAIKTDEKGQFRIDGPRSGATKLSVAAEGFDIHQSDLQLASAKETKLVVELQKKAATTITTEVPVAERPFVEFFGVRSRASTVGFVVDCSGSMQGPRIRRTKAELAKSVIDLNPKQQFFLSFFNNAEIPMPGGSPVEASPLEKVVSYNWIKTVGANGGTQPESALQLVAGTKPHVIFLLSDGEFSPLSDETMELFKKHEIVVNTLAFEDESGAKLLKGIAEATGGTYRFVPAGELPTNFELMIDTRLAMLLIDALNAPSPSDPQQYRKALVEFCGQEDFGPRQNGTEAEVEKAMRDWMSWWVQYKLVPHNKTASEDELLKEMRHPEPVRRWAAVEAARIRKLDLPSDYIAALQDTDINVRDAAHRALVELAGQDFGKVGDVSSADRSKAIDEWKGWLARQKVIAGFTDLSSAALAVRFGDSRPDMRKAAFDEAGKRRLSNPDAYIAGLGDPDIKVRNAAHDALVKSINGEVDFGPAPDANAAQWTQAAEKWKDWRAQKMEAQAQLALRQAKVLLRKTDPATRKAAEERLRKILADYPNSEAAKEIRKALSGN